MLEYNETKDGIEIVVNNKNNLPGIISISLVMFEFKESNIYTYITNRRISMRLLAML